MIPLILRLKKALHREIAKAQDIVVEALFDTFDEAVLHGGTAIWRCYGGNRFSEDIDVYLKKNTEKITEFFELLKSRGFVLEKKKIGARSIYSTLRLNRVIVRFEAVFKIVNGSLKEYEASEGNLITVYALEPEEIITEKIAAYIGRRKIRDLYDIFFLLRHVQDSAPIKKELKKLVTQFKKPIDEKELRVLIIDGLVPSTEKMLSYIRQRL